MRVTDLKVAFFGTSRLAQIVLEKLINSPYKPDIIVTAPNTKAGRGRKIQAPPVKQTALNNRIDILQPSTLNDTSLARRGLAKLEQIDIAILVAYGNIIPEDTLKIPKHGFINVHPSILPKFRGPSPIQSVITAAEEKTGVTIIKLDKEVDHGPILAQEEIGIEGDDTHASLIEKLGKLGADLLIKTLPEYLEGRLKPKPQDHTHATFTKRITKSDGLIDLYNPPNPLDLDRMIRAYYPWPGTWCRLIVNGKLLIVKLLPNSLKTPARLASESVAGRHKPPDPFLIQPEGKRPMTTSEFKNGYHEAFKQISKLFGL